jgi:hypothetical protein
MANTSNTNTNKINKREIEKKSQKIAKNQSPIRRESTVIAMRCSLCLCRSVDITDRSPITDRLSDRHDQTMPPQNSEEYNTCEKSQKPNKPA